MMLSKVLKEYRERYGLTQVQLAENLSVDERTLRRWENQETILKDIGELRRIASVLGVEAERLGVLDKAIAVTGEQAEEMGIECVQLCRKFGTIRLLERIYSAQSYLQRLTRNIGQSSNTLREALDGQSEY